MIISHSVDIISLSLSQSLVNLEFGVDKCHKMHVGQNYHLCPDLYVDNWELKKIKNLGDIYARDFEMENVEDEKYLGDIITDDGYNLKNIMKRKSKEVGVVSPIMTFLENTLCGLYYFQVAVTLR